MSNRWLAGAALTICLVCPGVAAPLVVNGGFETGDLDPWDGSGIITCSTDPAFAHTGNGSAAFLAFISPSELFQDLTTVAGHQYLVEFWAFSAEVPFSSTFDATFGVGGVSIGPTLTDSYTRYSFLTTALGSVTRLSFTTNPDPQGSTTDTYFLDDVSVTDLSAPEIQPSQSSLPLGLAIGMLLLARSGRRLRVS